MERSKGTKTTKEQWEDEMERSEQWNDQKERKERKNNGMINKKN